MIQVPEEPLLTPGNTGVIPPVDTPESTSATNAEVLRLEELAEVLKDEVVQLRQQLQSQTETHERQNKAYQQQLEAKDKQIEQLHVLLQQAQAALPAPRDNRSWWQRLWRRD
jgi:Tfp pilus assembly protein FimV